MRKTDSQVRMVAALLVLTAGLGGCVVYPAYGEYGAYYSGPAVAVAPPPDRVEAYGEPPVAGYVWFGGYWNWVGGRHVWVAGHWAAPRRGYTWVPHRWMHERDGWHMAKGHWARR